MFHIILTMEFCRSYDDNHFVGSVYLAPSLFPPHPFHPPLSPSNVEKNYVFSYDDTHPTETTFLSGMEGKGREGKGM